MQAHSASFKFEFPDEHLACVRRLISLGRVIQKRSKMSRARGKQ